MDSETYNSLFISASHVGACSYRTATGPANGTDGDDRTLSMWLSCSAPAGAGDNGLIFGSVSATFSIREKGGIEGCVASTLATQRPKMTAAGGAGWVFLALTVESGANAISYINGAASNTKSIGATTEAAFGNHLQIGPQSGQDQTQAVRDCIMWDKALSATEVFALYQASASYGDPAFGVAEKLFWFKPDESIALGSKANGNRLKNHGSLATGDLILQDKDEGETVEIISDAPFTDSGDLRVHYRSTGSLPDVETNKHYWTLDSQNEQITMNVKTKEIYLSSDGGDVDYSLHADLTNIPSSRMYQHTGSGVDE